MELAPDRALAPDLGRAAAGVAVEYFAGNCIGAAQSPFFDRPEPERLPFLALAH